MTQTTTAILASSLSWDNSSIFALEPRYPRDACAEESMAWQALSNEGSHAESYAQPVPIRRNVVWGGKAVVLEPSQGEPPREVNRILEVHGLMGAIGEQYGLAWTAEQDVQRLVKTSAGRSELHQLLVARAQAELSAHFLLGAAHSIANLVLRVLLLNTEAADVLTTTYKQAHGFPPGSDDRLTWPTFNKPLVTALKKAADASGSAGMIEAVANVDNLFTHPIFLELDGRRGMDYHRRRPQSVPHASPRTGTVSTDGATTTIAIKAPALEPEADALAVHAIVVDALDAIRQTMFDLRGSIPEAVRGQGINYPYSRAN